MKGRNRPLLKKQNTASIKEIIYKFGPISRSEIAEMLSLTPPTITTNVTELMRDGLVEECEDDTVQEKPASLGRKPIKIDFVSDARYVAGIELGPYHTSYCIMDLRGNIVAQYLKEIVSERYSEMLRQVSKEISDLWEKSGIKREKILGVGVGLPGFIDSKEGLIRSSFRSGWNNQRFADDLSELVGMPVKIQNNVRARAIKSELFNRQIDADTFAYFFISHGIACPLVIKHSILSGETDGAGEVGHMVMKIDGPICLTCGNRGCLDAIASERAIRRRVAEALASSGDNPLFYGAKNPVHPDIDEILEAQKAGDKMVTAIMQDAVTYLGISLANIINLISPKLVFVDALIMRLDENREMLTKITKRNMFGLNSQEVDILFEDFDPMTGALGAATYAIQRLFIKQ